MKFLQLDINKLTQMIEDKLNIRLDVN